MHRGLTPQGEAAHRARPAERKCDPYSSMCQAWFLQWLLFIDGTGHGIVKPPFAVALISPPAHDPLACPGLLRRPGGAPTPLPSHLQVSSAALEVLRTAVRSCPRALDPPVLERLMPSVFLRTVDPRDTTRALAAGILDGACVSGGGSGMLLGQERHICV